MRVRGGGDGHGGKLLKHLENLLTNRRSEGYNDDR